MIIALKVKKSGGGEAVRLTLTEQKEGEIHSSDCGGDLFGNANHAEFYRSVALYLHTLHGLGHKVSYEDAAY